MAKRLPDYPRYQPAALRPPGAGAFYDFAAGVASRNPPKLKSSRLPRLWGNPAARAAVRRRSDPGSRPYVSFLLAGLPHEESPRRA